MRAPVHAGAVGAAPSAVSATDAGTSALDPCHGLPPAPRHALSARLVVQSTSSDQITGVRFDGRGLVAIASAADGIRVWDAHRHTLLRVIPPPSDIGAFVSFAWAPDDHRFAFGGLNRSVIVDERGKELERFDAPGGTIAWTPGSPGLPWTVSGSVFGFFNFRRIGSGRIEDIKLHPPKSAEKAIGRAVAFSSDGTTAVAVLPNERALGVFAPSGDSRVRIIPLGAMPTEALAVAAHGDRAALVIEPLPGVRQIVVVGTRAGSRVPAPLAAAVTGELSYMVAIAPDGSLVAATTIGGIALWTAGDGRVRWEREYDDVRPTGVGERGKQVMRGGLARYRSRWFTSVAFSANGRDLVVGDASGRAFTLDAGTGRLTGELGNPIRAPLKVHFSRAGDLLAISLDRVSVWSLKEARIVASAFIPDLFDAVATGESGYRVLRTPIELCPNLGHSFYLEDRPQLGEARSAASRRCFDPGEELVGASLAGRIGLTRRPVGAPLWFEWAAVDLDTGARALLERPESAGLTSMSISEDGTRIAGVLEKGSAANVGAVWDARTGKLLRELALGEKGTGVARVALSPDGRRIALARYRSDATPVSVRSVVENEAPDVEIVVPEQVYNLTFAFTGSKDGLLASVPGRMRVYEGPALVAEDSAPGVWGVAADLAGRRFAGVGSNGAVHVFDGSKAALLASFLEFEDDEYVAFTPRGAYTGTAEAADRIAWVFDAPYDAHRFEQFASTFGRLDIVRCRLAGRDVDMAALPRRPPSVSILDAPARAAAGTSVRVRVKVSSTSGVAKVRAFAEGRLVAELPVGKQETELSLEIPLLAGVNRVSVVAFDDAGMASAPTAADITGTAKPVQRQPDLWVVAVGVGSYSQLSSDKQLAYSTKDARAVAQRFASYAGPGRPYAEPHVKTLLDADVTADSVRAALGELNAMKSDDVAVVFFAGHGAKPSSEADMRFLPGTVAPTAASIEAVGIGWRLIAEQLAKAKGRVVVLLDACHSGHLSQDLLVPNDAMASALARDGRAGVVVFAAAKGREESLEPAGGQRGLVLDAKMRSLVRSPVSDVIENGYFTAALLAALADARTDRDGDGYVQFSELVAETTRRVSIISAGRQTPWVARRELFGDFALTRRAAASP